MIERLDSARAAAVCEILGLDPDAVCSLVITPRAVFVTTARRNADGHAFIDGLSNDLARDYAVIPGLAAV